LKIWTNIKARKKPLAAGNLSGGPDPAGKLYTWKIKGKYIDICIIGDKYCAAALPMKIG